MTDLKNKIQNNIIKPYLDGIFTTVKASVTSFDSYRNRANIKYRNPKGRGILEAKKVPIQIYSQGIYASTIEEGSMVWVSFENGSPLKPKIVGIIDESYELSTREKMKHILQGGLITREYEKKEPKIKNRINSWISDKSPGYANQIEYVNFDIEKKYLEIAEKLGYYEEKEIGLTHTVNGATIKITNEGNINIFTAINQGISISTSDNKITITSLNEIFLNSPNVKINTENINVSARTFKINNKDLI